MHPVAPPALASWSAWDALSDDARRAVTADLATALGDDWEAAGLAGARRLGVLRHRPDGEEFVMVPGGSFVMGLSDDEEARIVGVLRALPGFADVSDDERAGVEATLRREVRAIADCARPLRTVRVAPFLCGRRHRAAPLLPAWRALAEAEWEYVARAGAPDGWLLRAPLTWGNDGAPDHALTQESALGLFDLISWDGEGFADDAWPPGGGYRDAPDDARAFAPEDGERDAIARGGPCYEWSSEVAGVWAFFAGARSNAYGQGRRAARSFAPAR